MPIISSPGTQFGYGQQPVFGGCIGFGSDSSSNLTIAHSPDFNWDGSLNWTIEFFYYRTSNAVNQTIFEYGNVTTLSNGIGYFFDSSGVARFRINGSGSIYSAETGLYELNKWIHIAFSRQNNSDVFVYLNGTRFNIVNRNLALTTTADMRIGNSANRNRKFFGFISNFRYVVGTALYTTSSFAPITKPLSNVSNTKLLLIAKNESGYTTNDSGISYTITPERTQWNSKTPFS